MKDKRPREYNEHRMGQATRENQRRNPDQKDDDPEDGPPCQDNRKRRQQYSKYIVHTVNMDGFARNGRGNGIKISPLPPERRRAAFGALISPANLGMWVQISQEVTA